MCETKPGLLTTNVGETMSPVEYRVSATDKMENVANEFIARTIGSAPVVDEIGRCIGIITNGDLVRYQSQLSDANAYIHHGTTIEVKQQDPDGSLELVSHPFDEVQRQMTTSVQTIQESSTLEFASKIMWRQHIHHLVVLDESERPIGILSSLDILAKLNGEK